MLSIGTFSEIFIVVNAPVNYIVLLYWTRPEYNTENTSAGYHLSIENICPIGFEFS